MRISLIQSKLHWENSALNLRMFSEQLADLAGKTDLVVLPEMFTTGFSMHPQRLAETMDGPTMKWLSQTAQELDSAVTGSFICVENGKYYNRLVFMFPDGSFECYDKRHLFSLAGEDEVFTPGNKKLVLSWKGFRICPLICYDLRFPVWSRNLDVAPYDLLIYVANWPNRRSHHWRSLVPARAIENQSFVAAVNVFGTDGNQLEYQGDSMLTDFSGQTICQISGREGILSAELTLDELINFRQQLPFLKDADAFQLRV